VESEFFLAGGETTLICLLTRLRPDLIVGDRGDAVRARRALARAPGSGPFFLWLL